MWSRASILSYSKLEYTLLLISGPIVLFLLKYVSLSYVNLITILLLILFDSGHVYTTFWRTIFHPQTEKLRYIKACFLIFIFFLTLSILKINFFWSIVLYATAFHYIKQSVGFYHRFRKGIKENLTDDLLVYILFLTPFILFLFDQNNLGIQFYSTNDLLIIPNQEIFIYGEYILLMTWIFYFFRVILRFKSNEFNLKEIIYVFSTSGFFAYLFLSHTISPSEVIIPLIATHTIPYIALITKSLKETRPYSAFQKHLSTYTLVIATMISFGLFEFYIENNFLEFDLSKGPVVLNSIIRSLYLIPLFLHFYSDSIIWKRSYKENLN